MTTVSFDNQVPEELECLRFEDSSKRLDFAGEMHLGWGLSVGSGNSLIAEEFVNLIV